MSSACGSTRTSPGSPLATVSDMSSVIDQNVLDAIAHSLEFEVFSIESARGRETVHGIGLERLQIITGLSAQELDASTTRLSEAGLIDCGDATHSVFDWLLGQRPATCFWVTPAGHRLINAQNNDIDQRQEEAITRPPRMRE